MNTLHVRRLWVHQPSQVCDVEAEQFLKAVSIIKAVSIVAAGHSRSGGLVTNLPVRVVDSLLNVRQRHPTRSKALALRVGAEQQAPHSCLSLRFEKKRIIRIWRHKPDKQSWAYRSARSSMASKSCSVTVGFNTMSISRKSWFGSALLTKSGG